MPLQYHQFNMQKRVLNQFDKGLSTEMLEHFFAKDREIGIMCAASSNAKALNRAEFVLHTLLLLDRIKMSDLLDANDAFNQASRLGSAPRRTATTVVTPTPLLRLSLRCAGLALSRVCVLTSPSFGVVGGRCANEEQKRNRSSTSTSTRSLTPTTCVSSRCCARPRAILRRSTRVSTSRSSRPRSSSTTHVG